MADHEKIPVKGEEFDSLVMRDKRNPVTTYAVFIKQKLGSNHVWKYKSYDFRHSDEWEIPSGSSRIYLKPDQIRTEMQEGTLVELTEREFAEVAPLIKERFDIEPRMRI